MNDTNQSNQKVGSCPCTCTSARYAEKTGLPAQARLETKCLPHSMHRHTLPVLTPGGVLGSDLPGLRRMWRIFRFGWSTLVCVICDRSTRYRYLRTNRTPQDTTRTQAWMGTHNFVKVSWVAPAINTEGRR